MYGVWKKQVELVAERKNIRSKSLCLGRVSCLVAHQEELLRFIFELREQGMAVLVSMVMIKAAQLSPEFLRNQDSLGIALPEGLPIAKGLSFASH
jgi:hypothetical protein